MATSLGVSIHRILQELGEEDFKVFKVYLGDYTSIPWCQLDKADRADTSVKMKETYPQTALEIIMSILKDINRNDLVQRFSPSVTEGSTPTKVELNEREELDKSVEILQKQVKLGLAKLDEIKKTAQILETHKSEMAVYRNFEFEITIKKPVQVVKDGKYIWEYKDVKEKRTVKELREKYETASKKMMLVENTIAKLKSDYDDLQMQVVKLMERSGKGLNRLKEIALKPNPLSIPEYIDLLIEGEKSEGKPGFMDRIKSLKGVRAMAEYMAKVE